MTNPDRDKYIQKLLVKLVKGTAFFFSMYLVTDFFLLLFTDRFQCYSEPFFP